MVLKIALWRGSVTQLRAVGTRPYYQSSRQGLTTEKDLQAEGPVYLVIGSMGAAIRPEPRGWAALL